MFVRLRKALRINVHGFDAEPALFGVGEHEVTARVAAFVAANPEYGSVIGEVEHPADGAVSPEIEGDGSGEAEAVIEEEAQPRRSRRR